MKELRNIAIGVVLGLLAAGAILLAVSPPRGEPILLSPRPTEAPLVISIQGEVVHPGVYSLPRDARLQDAIEAAGGLTERADSLPLRLAAPLKDGDAILLLSKDSNTSTLSTQSSILALATPALPENLCVNINSATASELESLPGIGPTRAEEIIDYRTLNGPFYKPEDLMQVTGIGPATFESLRNRIETDAISGCK